MIRRLPYSDERLAKIMGLDPSEFMFLPGKEEIKRVVRTYNYTLDEERAIIGLTSIMQRHRRNELVQSSIPKLITHIKLRLWDLGLGK